MRPVALGKPIRPNDAQAWKKWAEECFAELERVSHENLDGFLSDTDRSILNGLTGSGVVTGGVLSIGTGGAGVATTFTIAAGTGQIADNAFSPTSVRRISWTAKTDVAVTNLLTQLVTYVAIDVSGAVIQSATDFTPAQMREYIVIGVVVHSNQTTVNAVNQTQIVSYNPGGQINDLFYSLGLFNVSGNVFSANGANLKLNKSAGSIFRRGANYSSLTDNPHIVTTGVLTQAPLRMQNVTGAGSASTTDVDVANYDVGGVTTAISPSNRFSILRIFLFQSNLIAVQRGQAVYASMAEAKAAIQTEPYTTNAILAANGLLRGFLVVRANATDLTVATDAFFIEAGRFGGSSGVGGLSVSTLQNAYDNSSAPEILTDSTRGALSIKRGSAADTDAVLEAINNADATTFTVAGNGAAIVSGSGGLGYGTGSGGAQTQGTSRTTGVTLDKTNGAITLFSAAGSATYQTFTVTNATVAATDTVIVNQKSGTDLYEIHVTAVGAGSFNITFRTTGGTTTEQPVFNFAVVKAATS